MNDWSELDETTDIDVEEIMEKIRAYIAENRLQQDLHDVQLTEFNLKGILSPGIYEHISSALRSNSRLAVTPDARRSGLPIVGPIVDALRRSLHGLVVFYVNKGAARQVAVNTSILKALGALVSEVETWAEGSPAADSDRERPLAPSEVRE